MNGGRGREIWVISTYAILLLMSAGAFFAGLQELRAGGSPALISAGIVCLIVVSALAPIGILVATNRSTPNATGPSPELLNKQTEILEQIHEHTLLSDGAKRIFYRRDEREMLRRAIEEDISHEDWEAATVLVEDMAARFGYREEAEEFRQRIEQAQADVVSRRIDEAMLRFEQMLTDAEWTAAHAEAARLQRLFPGSHRVKNLDDRVSRSREDRKHSVERQFLEAAARGEIDHAMELLKELDHYLTEREAEPYREVAKGVISKARENLGLQFKMAVQDHDWATAVRVGDRIIDEFPNSLMAREVRERIDVLRSRVSDVSTGEKDGTGPATEQERSALVEALAAARTRQKPTEV